MADNPVLTGPDLGRGVALSDLPEGAPFLGHTAGEQVVLVRRGNDVQAVGAFCTHYHGPLAEGLVVGDTIRCPWHHACFSLKSGEAVAAPALNAVTHFPVDVRDGKVFVKAAAEAATYKLPRPVSPPASVVIVGAGAAGNACAEMLRRQGFFGPITMITAESEVPYDRPNLSKDYLAGNAPEDWIPLRPSTFYAERGIKLMFGKRVTALDPAKKIVTLDDGTSISFGALLLATGATPIKLDIPGADKDRFFYLRSLADSRAIVAAAKEAKKAVVLGASFIGLEVAASLRARELEVHVVAPEARPLERILGPQLGDFIRSLHESKGVTFHLGLTASSWDGRRVTLSNGETIDAHIVVAGIGVRPNDALASAAGLTVDKGVVVNEFLETSAKDVYAAGDIARYPDKRVGAPIRVEHWVLAERHGQTAAKNILGFKEPFTTPPFFWSQHYDVPINYVGHAQKWDTIDVEGDLNRRDAAVRFKQGGKTLAVATIGRDIESLEAEVEMERAG